MDLTVCRYREFNGASHCGKGEAFRHIIYEPESEIYCRNASPLRIDL
ncbi:MAG: hypothetical protein JGK31_31185 [Microcoleus sp. PH2017_30_WIL_O_A]|nr:hypothetical protein [Microcoleus sp. PH2017_30_WIL_O_A]